MYACSIVVGDVFNDTLSKNPTSWKRGIPQIRSAGVYDYYPVPHFVHSIDMII